MVFKQDTQLIEDLTSKDKDDIDKEPLDGPTESLYPWRKPSKIEVDLHSSLLPMTFHFYQNFVSVKTHNLHTLFLHAHFTNVQLVVTDTIQILHKNFDIEIIEINDTSQVTKAEDEKMDTDDIEDVFKVLITANICSISIVNV